MIKSKKRFDCVEFKQKSQTKIFNKIKNLSAEDEILYFKKKALSSPLGNWWKEVLKTKEVYAVGSQKKRRGKTATFRSILHRPV